MSLTTDNALTPLTNRNIGKMHLICPNLKKSSLTLYETKCLYMYTETEINKTEVT